MSRTLSLAKPPATPLTTTRASLISATPLVRLLDTLRDDIARIRARTPNAPDLQTLQVLAEDLSRAMDEARRTDVWLTPKEVHALTHRPISTITRWCAQHGDGKWAHWKNGWNIHWPGFEVWLKTRDRQEAA